MSGPGARWLLQRIALLDSPLLMIAAIASIFTDRPLLGIALALLSFGFYMLGRPSLWQRHPPGDPRNPEPIQRGREPRPGPGEPPAAQPPLGEPRGLDEPRPRDPSPARRARERSRRRTRPL